MDYVYEMNVWGFDRTVRATYVEPESKGACDFQPVDAQGRGPDGGNGLHVQHVPPRDPGPPVHRTGPGQDDARRRKRTVPRTRRRAAATAPRCRYRCRRSWRCTPTPSPTRSRIYGMSSGRWQNGERQVRRYRDKDGNGETIQRPYGSYPDRQTEEAVGQGGVPGKEGPQENPGPLVRAGDSPAPRLPRAAAPRSRRNRIPWRTRAGRRKTHPA